MIVPILAALAIATAPTPSFNLVCTGKTFSREAGALAKPLGAFSDTYRVDMKRGRWCNGKCTTSQPVYSVTDGEIVFRFHQDGDTGYVTKVNRESGEYSDMLDFGDGRIFTIGNCGRAPFTGLPERQF